jgi:ABC-type glutathione transport system ATPase component
MSEMDLSAALIESEGERVVSVRELVKRYDGGLVEALRGVSFDVRKGEFFVIMGPSGSGKSTLLYLLGALDEASSGTVSVFGEDLAKARDLEKNEAREDRLCFSAPSPHSDAQSLGERRAAGAADEPLAGSTPAPRGGAPGSGRASSIAATFCR